jgi:hypothetical protein
MGAVTITEGDRARAANADAHLIGGLARLRALNDGEATRSRDLSLAITHVEDALLRLTKYRKEHL